MNMGENQQQKYCYTEKSRYKSSLRANCERITSWSLFCVYAVSINQDLYYVKRKYVQQFQKILIFFQKYN